MNATPEVSVVVATRDRRSRLTALLRSLREQDLDPERFEVVMVDDGSRDDTNGVLEAEREAGRLRLRAISNPESRGPAAARNVGWQAAAAPLVAFTDDDCEVDSDWLPALLEAAERAPGAILQGRTEPIPRERALAGPYSRTLEITTLGPFFQTCNIAYPREILERLGGFEETVFRRPVGEDTDLAWRALSEGDEIVFVGGARVYHAVNQLGAVGKLRLALKWSDSMAVFARHPGMRTYLHRRFFWKPSHRHFLRAALGVALASRFPPAILLAYPYLRQVHRRAAGDGALVQGYLVLYDGVEIYAVVRGALRHRVLIL
ncbi:MAG: glycosyltransferase family 2 protein [Solirubrobacterales bacterium]